MATQDTERTLQDFAATGSEAAFRQLVERHVDLVYSTALRRVAGDAHLAQDLVQTVFTDLAQRARSQRGLNSENIRCLSGWLYRHTCLKAAELIRSERRRAAREQIAAEMNELNQSTPESKWREVAPVLDDAMTELDDADRNALVLRFFDRCDLKAVGAAMGLSDDTAQKRVSRALEKLRTLLARRGITSTAAALGMTLTTHAVTAAPAGLAASIATPVLTVQPSDAGMHEATGVAAGLQQFATLLVAYKWTTISSLVLIAVVSTLSFAGWAGWLINLFHHMLAVWHIHH